MAPELLSTILHGPPMVSGFYLRKGEVIVGRHHPIMAVLQESTMSFPLKIWGKCLILKARLKYGYFAVTGILKKVWIHP